MLLQKLLSPDGAGCHGKRRRPKKTVTSLGPHHVSSTTAVISPSPSLTPQATAGGKKCPSRRDMTTWAFQQGQEPPVAFTTSGHWHEQWKVVNCANKKSFQRTFRGWSDPVRPSESVRRSSDAARLHNEVL
ncbi:hypothetical protein HPB50_023588 [Hyalomma asiaticum]|uniref:Uncharacterized protein n=1 Tax=Hyalomma asiaticum TaxID=266040 RepID=A0ACB7T8N8_HYAAI|nr:hypothetical protein HPB50_023588 [Hyalomma asiaticum]